MEHTEGPVVTEDDCRLWTASVGHGTPLIVCHGGPGLWDMFDDMDGAHDIRPRWAVDSLKSATRVVLGAAGHVPWLEAPDEFYSALLGFLS